ncbi:MAG: 4-aminobutyrate--2-oxoglutarate transaminase [Alphaproteobacteria bacterium]|nr:MAG: 4-aminobutyrate--2-oxoglutarate transaminase [Alphaproteobacteria bacterium]
MTSVSKTPVSNEALWQRRETAVAPGVSTLHRRFTVAASNTEIVDADGRRYIDFATGIAVCNTGHSHPRIVAAVKRQLDKFSHVCFQVTPFEAYIALAEKLNAIAPGPTPKKTLFVTTGAEAVENAVKIARAHTRRRGVVAFRGGYHGRTLMTMALTGKVHPYKAHFGPMPGEVYHAQYPFEYHGIGEDEAFASFLDIFKSDIEPAATAAVIIEPVLGEGGFYVTPPAFLRRLRAYCDAHGILLIADEIQTGFARTGKMFALEHAGIEPDLMTVAKAMAGGFPIAGVVGKAPVMDACAPGGLGGTYAGSPLGCVAGLEVLKIIEDDKLCERANAIGAQIKQRLAAARDGGMACIGDVRGLGAMVAVEFVKDGRADRPQPELTKKVLAAAAENGLLLLSCGVRGNVIRFLPALTASDATIAEGMDILIKTLEQVAPGHVEADMADLRRPARRQGATAAE